jgi:serine phosphatase RsbU (regulator of sigma subunit)
MKLRRILTLGGAMVSGLIVLTLDVIRTSVAISGLEEVRGLLVICSFVLLYLFVQMSDQTRIQDSVRRLGLILVAAVVVALMTTGMAFFTDTATFEAKEGKLLPLNFKTVFLAAFVSLSFAVLTILLFRFLWALVLYKRKKGTKRNLIILALLMVATSVSTFGLDPLDTSVFTSILFGFSCAAMLVNSFRLSWIVYLTKREKVFSLIYAFLLFGVLTYLNVATHTGMVHQILLYHSYPLKEFVGQTLLFGNIYAGMAFVSTLFHLPTAEAYERKATELSSLHTLGKLVTQVFDFNELVDTVTSMTLQVCEAKSCWLEIIQKGDRVPKGGSGHQFLHATSGGSYVVQVLGRKNIEAREVEQLVPFGEEETVRGEVIREGKPVVIDDLSRDSRFRPGEKGKTRSGSMVVVPLLSHTELIGILYATKDTGYGFFKDDVEVVSVFADQATIALENSRLIDKSIERERLLREMMLAQEMQKRLLPQTLPEVHGVEIDAVSTPAFEVGGDYYDVVMLDQHRLGVVVGDVSGKGVSAAFYMSEVKGIFQSLSRIHPSPRDLLVRANEVLAGSIDRRSFVSLIYAVLDTRNGLLTVCRAGHCPMLLAREGGIHYIRPSGMGLGLSRGSAFEETVREEMIQLQPGDLCLFYTDGLTEARNGEDEFGYERLMRCAANIVPYSAREAKDAVLEHVREFTAGQSLHDDLTLVVLKWCGTEATGPI